jgi:hypothetical protein
VAKNQEAEKGQNRLDLDGEMRLKFLVWNILRKFERAQPYHCQISEYLTLLNSFPDVKKTV